MSDSEKLSAKQILFVDEYLVDLNASGAARRAGYSKVSSDKIGSQLLGKTRVKSLIAEKMRNRSQQIGINSDHVLNELIKIAFSNSMDCFTIHGNSLKINNEFIKDPILSKTIESVTIGRNGVSLKFVNKVKAMEILLKHLSVNQKADENSESGIERIQRIIKERAERLRAKENIT